MSTHSSRSEKRLISRVKGLGSMLSRDEGTLDRAVARLRRPLDRLWYRRQGRLREIAELAASVGRSNPAEVGPRVLVVSLRIWVQHAGVEAVIAQALKLRGAQVAILTCGGGMPICEIGWARKMVPRPCDRCAAFTGELAEGAELTHYRLADEFPWGARADRAPEDPAGPDPASDPYAAGEMSAAWFVKSDQPMDEPEGPDVVRDYAVSAAAVEAAASRLLDRFVPDVVFAVNGLFMAERVLRSLCAERGIRFTSYEASPRADSYVLSHGRPATEMDTTDLWAEARNDPLDGEQSAALGRLLGDRAQGVGAHERYFDVQVDERAHVRADLEIPPDGRMVAAFTNLAWDTALQGCDVGYESMFDWLASIVGTMEDHPDTFLVIRVHPAEGRWGTRQPARGELLDRIGALPANVRLVDPTDPLSSYAIMAMSDLVLTYTSTIGVEAAARGVPVAVAAKTHYRARGFTRDIESHRDIEHLLGAPPVMTPDEIELARRYAFAFFFRRLVPFPAVTRDGVGLGRVPLDAGQIAPGSDPYLDFVCNRILDGAPCHLPAELALAR